MTTPLSPLETRALKLIQEWGISSFPYTNWGLVRKLADALEEEFEQGYQAGKLVGKEAQL